MAERDDERRDERFVVESGGAPAGTGMTVYGAWWCGDTRRSVALLDKLSLAYAYISVDDDPTASAWAAAQNDGQRRIPVVVLGTSGTTLIEPSDEALLAVIGETGYLGGRVASQSYDESLVVSGERRCG